MLVESLLDETESVEEHSLYDREQLLQQYKVYVITILMFFCCCYATELLTEHIDVLFSSFS